MPRSRLNPALRQAGGAAETDPSRFVVAGYLRVSTEEQAKSGLGLGDQRRRISGMAAAKGWPEPVLYADEGISGTKDSTRRPGLARLLAEVRERRVNAVIVLDLSRIGRRTRIVLDMAEEMSRYGVSLVSCKESLDTTTPQGQFVLTMFAALAQLERDQIAERTRAALAEHSRRDGEAGGRMPYGYARSETGARIERDAARIVRFVFLWRGERATMREIANRLNKRRIPGPRGKRWHHSSIAAVLANERAYRGGERGASQVRWPVILKSDEAQGEACSTSGKSAIP